MPSKANSRWIAKRVGDSLNPAYNGRSSEPSEFPFRKASDDQQTPQSDVGHLHGGGFGAGTGLRGVWPLRQPPACHACSRNRGTRALVLCPSFRRSGELTGPQTDGSRSPVPGLEMLCFVARHGARGQGRRRRRTAVSGRGILDRRRRSFPLGSWQRALVHFARAQLANTPLHVALLIVPPCAIAAQGSCRRGLRAGGDNVVSFLVYEFNFLHWRNPCLVNFADHYLPPLWRL